MEKLFQISLKLLVMDSSERLLIIQEIDGTWELPGGRLEAGEEIFQALEREVLEEMGVGIKNLNKSPKYIYSTFDSNKKPRLMIFFEGNLSSFNISKTQECASFRFVEIAEFIQMPLIAQLRPLQKLLATSSD